MRPLFTDVAVHFDSHLQPANTDWYVELFDEVSRVCYGMFDSEDWYVEGYDESTRKIKVRNRYSTAILYFLISADPIDAWHEQWLIVDVFIDNEPKNPFQQ